MEVQDCGRLLVSCVCRANNRRKSKKPDERDPRRSPGRSSRVSVPSPRSKPGVHGHAMIPRGIRPVRSPGRSTSRRQDLPLSLAWEEVHKRAWKSRQGYLRYGSVDRDREPFFHGCRCGIRCAECRSGRAGSGRGACHRPVRIQCEAVRQRRRPGGEAPPICSRACAS